MMLRSPARVAPKTTAPVPEMSPAPAIVMHHLGGGVSIEVVPNVTLDLAYYHAFENSDSGPIEMPTGVVAGTDVRNRLSEHSVNVGVHVSFEEIAP